MINKKATLVLLFAVLFSIPAFAEYELSEIEAEFSSVAYIAVVVPEDGDYEIPQNILNNEFYIESMRLTKLAHDTYDYGDYDASAGFAEEAMLYARRADEYVSTQLINEAKRLLDWADSNNIADRYPTDYSNSKGYYEGSVEAHENEEWDESITLAINSIQIMAALEQGVSPAATATAAGLPAQFTVRPWATYRDCFWNIAGYSQIYGDPWKWRILYEANKSKLPDPNNPDLVEPGTVLDIPR